MLTIVDIYTIHICHIGNICLSYYALIQFVNVAQNNQIGILLMPNIFACVGNNFDKCVLGYAWLLYSCKLWYCITKLTLFQQLCQI